MISSSTPSIDAIKTQEVRVNPSPAPLPVGPVPAVGELVQLAIRSNDAGQGQIFFQGQNLTASLPKNLTAGQTVLAKVISTEQLVFQLLQAPTTSAPAPKTVQSRLSQQLLASLKEIFPQLAADSANLSELLNHSTEIPAAKTAMENLLRNLKQLSLGERAQQNEKFLYNLTSGQTAELLRKAASELKQAAINLGAPNPSITNELNAEFFALLKEGIESNLDSKAMLDKLLGRLNTETKNSKSTGKENSRFTEAVKELSQQLQLAAESRGKPEPLAPTNQRLIAELKTLLSTKLEPKVEQELMKLAERLDRLAASLDQLNTLNPLLSSLGQSGLLLLPFFAEGVLQQGKLSFEFAQDKKSEGDRDYSENSEQEGQPGLPFEKLNLNLPLPNLGSVQVAIAYRPREILLRLNLENKDASEFMLERITELRTCLSALGFEKNEITLSAEPAEQFTLSWTEQASLSGIIA